MVKHKQGSMPPIWVSSDSGEWQNRCFLMRNRKAKSKLFGFGVDGDGVPSEPEEEMCWLRS